MRRVCVFLCLILSACQSPPSMFYQRSEYKIQRVGGLVASTSPKFSRQEFVSTPTQILVEESWVLQNIENKPVQVALGSAVAKIKDKSYPLTCTSEPKGEASVSVAPGEKVVVNCQWSLPKRAQERNDLWVTFHLPLSGGEAITSSKIIRAEDLQ